MCGVFFLPLDRLLHLTIPQHTAQVALYLLGLQIIAGMLFGFFKGSYMVVGVAHRGENFNNLWQLSITVGTVALAFFHQSFAWLAAAQLLMTLLSALVMIADLWRVAPDIRPTIRYWKRRFVSRDSQAERLLRVVVLRKHSGLSGPGYPDAAHPRAGSGRHLLRHADDLFHEQALCPIS